MQGAAVALAVLLSAAVAEAKVCMVEGPFGCMSWAPSPPPGWSSTGGDNTAYPNEVVICTGTNMDGWCFYKGITPGTQLLQSPMGDLDTCETGAGWCVRSIRTSLARTSWVFNHVGQGLPLYTCPAAGTVTNFTTFNVSSAQWRN